MKSDSTDSNSNKCLRQFSDGRSCRMLRKNGHPTLCIFHAREEQQLLESDKLAAMAEKRISHQTAGTLGHVGQLLLQSIPAVKNEINAAVRHPDAYDAMIRDSLPFLRRFRKQYSREPPSKPFRMRRSRPMQPK